jgi:hypothetical protein
MTSRLTVCVLVLISVGTNAHGKADETKQPAAETSSGLKDIPDAEYRKIADSLEKAVLSGDRDSVNELIDWEAIVTRALTPSEAYEDYDKEFRSATLRDLKNENGLAAGIIKLTKEGSRFRCLRIRSRGGKKCLLFRLLDSEKLSLDYFEFELRRKCLAKHPRTLLVLRARSTPSSQARKVG